MDGLTASGVHTEGTHKSNMHRTLTHTVGDAIRACTIPKRTIELCFQLWCCCVVSLVAMALWVLLHFAFKLTSFG